MEIENIWIDVDGVEGESYTGYNSNGNNTHYYDSDTNHEDDEEDYESEADSDKYEISKNYNDSSLPEEMLDYFLSSERSQRHIKSLSYSLRNRSYNTYKVGSSNSNTRRNTNRSHKVTPKRKINNKSNSGIKKKTKKIIYLKYY